MTDRKSSESGRGPTKIGDLLKIYEVLPLSGVRANLSQIVERVDYTGQPVLISKNGKARVACVPLSVLANSVSHFMDAAERSLARHSEDRDQDRGDDIDFEQIPGLRAADLQATREQFDSKARDEDNDDEDAVRRIVGHPAFVAEIKNVIMSLAAERALEMAHGTVGKVVTPPGVVEMSGTMGKFFSTKGPLVEKILSLSKAGRND